MASFTDVGVVAVVQGLTQFNSANSIMRHQMGLTGSSARSFSKGFNNSMTGIGQSITNAGRTIRGFGNELTFLGFQLTFLATGAFAAVTAAGIEFESNLVKMSTLANVAVENLGDIGQALKDLAPLVGQVPTELADAFFDIVSSGFSAAEAMEIIEITAKGASIGLGDVWTVTDAVTSAMKAFTHDGLTAARATDILVQAVREGKGEVDALAGTIGRVTGIAGQLGVTFEEVTAFIASFTRVGVPAEVAVTSLRSALTNILKPTEAAKEVLAEYKIEMDNVKQIIEERGLLQAFLFLAETLKDDEEAFGRVIGSARGLAGVLINTGPLVDDYTDILAAIEGSAGAASEAFDLFAQTTEFKLERAKAAFESLFITVSSTLRPIVNLLLDQIPKITQAIEELVQTNPALFLLAGGFSLVVAAAGPLLIVAGLMITSIGTLISAFGAFAVAIGSVLSPIGLVVGSLVALAATITGLFIASFQKTQQKLAEQGRAISINAYEWGRNIIIQFARGMAAAITYVLQVLTAIGKAIANWLAPGSPPKLLPDIDKWGKGAMEAYMDGWLQADFSVFQNIASTIESFLRSIEMPEVDIVPLIMGVRLELAKIIDQFRETGRVSMDAINGILEGFGDAGKIVGEYVRAMLDLERANQAVEEAQKALNAVQQKYNELLEPISKELKEIQDRRQEVIDAQREEELQAILDDPNAPALVRELALMELREIALKRQARAIEDQRDEEVSAAQDRLSAAEEEQKLAEARAEALRQFISIQEKNNQLIEEQIQLLKQLANALGGAGGGVDVGEIEEPELGLGELPTGGGGFDIDEALGKDFSEEMEMFKKKIGGIGGPEEFLEGEGGLGSLEGLFGDIDLAAQDLVASLGSIASEIATAWQPVIDAAGDTTDAWSDVFSSDLGAPGSPIMEFVTIVGELIDQYNISEFIGNFNPLAQAMERIGQVAPFVVIAAGAVKAFFDALVEAFDAMGPEGAGGITEISEGLGGIQDIVEGFDTLPELFERLVLDPLALVVIGVSSVIAGVAALGTIILTWIPTAAETFSTKVGEMNTAVENFINDSLGFIGDWAVDFLKWITGTSDKSEKRLGRMSKDGSGFIEKLKDNAIQFAKDMLKEVGKKVEELWEALVGEEGWITKIKSKGSELWGDLKQAALDKIGEIEPGVDAIFQQFFDWVGDQVDFFVGVGFDLGAGLLQGIMDALGPLIQFIEDLINSLIEAADDEGESTSPSKRMIEVGHNLMDGLLVGMANRAMAVEQTMRSIVADGIAAASEEEMALAMSASGDLSRGGYGTVAGPSASSGHYSYNNRESSFGPINVYNGMDMAALRALIRQEVNGAL